MDKIVDLFKKNCKEIFNIYNRILKILIIDYLISIFLHN